MADRRIANPRLLLPLAILAAFIFTMIAIFVAMSYTPDTGGEDAPAPTSSTTAPAR